MANYAKNYAKTYETVKRLRELFAKKQQLFVELQGALASPLVKRLVELHPRDSLLKNSLAALPPKIVKAVQKHRWGWIELSNYVLTLPGDVQLDVCMALLPFLLPEESE